MAKSTKDSTTMTKRKDLVFMYFKMAEGMKDGGSMENNTVWEHSYFKTVSNSK